MDERCREVTQEGEEVAGAEVRVIRKGFPRAQDVGQVCEWSPWLLVKSVG